LKKDKIILFTQHSSAGHNLSFNFLLFFLLLGLPLSSWSQGKLDTLYLEPLDSTLANANAPDTALYTANKSIQVCPSTDQKEDCKQIELTSYYTKLTFDGSDKKQRLFIGRVCLETDKSCRASVLNWPFKIQNLGEPETLYYSPSRTVDVEWRLGQEEKLQEFRKTELITKDTSKIFRSFPLRIDSLGNIKEWARTDTFTLVFDSIPPRFKNFYWTIKIANGDTLYRLDSVDVSDFSFASTGPILIDFDPTKQQAFLLDSIKPVQNWRIKIIHPALDSNFLQSIKPNNYIKLQDLSNNFFGVTLTKPTFPKGPKDTGNAPITVKLDSVQKPINSNLRGDKENPDSYHPQTSFDLKNLKVEFLFKNSKDSLNTIPDSSYLSGLKINSHKPDYVLTLNWQFISYYKNQGTLGCSHSKSIISLKTFLFSDSLPKKQAFWPGGESGFLCLWAFDRDSLIASSRVFIPSPYLDSSWTRRTLTLTPEHWSLVNLDFWDSPLTASLKTASQQQNYRFAYFTWSPPAWVRGGSYSPDRLPSEKLKGRAAVATSGPNEPITLNYSPGPDLRELKINVDTLSFDSGFTLWSPPIPLIAPAAQRGILLLKFEALKEPWQDSWVFADTLFPQMSYMVYSNKSNQMTLTDWLGGPLNSSSSTLSKKHAANLKRENTSPPILELISGLKLFNQDSVPYPGQPTGSDYLAWVGSTPNSKPTGNQNPQSPLKKLSSPLWLSLPANQTHKDQKILLYLHKGRQVAFSHPNYDFYDNQGRPLSKETRYYDPGSHLFSLSPAQEIIVPPLKFQVEKLPQGFLVKGPFKPLNTQIFLTDLSGKKHPYSLYPQDSTLQIPRSNRVLFLTLKNAGQTHTFKFSPN